MPTFNVEKYVRDAVLSILNQTWKDLELIIVDDCSTDNTYSILNELAKNDGRIVLMRNEINKKICKTLNKCLENAKGKYIVRMDGDDVSQPNRLEVMKKFLDSNPNIDLVGSYVISIDENGKEIKRKEYLCSPDFIKIGNRFTSSVLHIWMARREVYDNLNGYRDIPYVEDYDFLLRGQKLGYRYANISEYLYMVRIRAGNTADSNGLKQRKAKKFVQKINRKQIGNFENVEKMYLDAIAYRQAENKRYQKAQGHIRKAIESENHLLKFKNIIFGIIGSKYTRHQIYEGIGARCLKKVEQLVK